MGLEMNVRNGRLLRDSVSSNVGTAVFMSLGHKPPQERDFDGLLNCKRATLAYVIAFVPLRGLDHTQSYRKGSFRYGFGRHGVYIPLICLGGLLSQLFFV